jgi:hypothetical protein
LPVQWLPIGQEKGPKAQILTPPGVNMAVLGFSKSWYRQYLGCYSDRTQCGYVFG